MDHYVPRNSPGTPQFLIRGSEGVGWGGAGWDVFSCILLYSLYLRVILLYFTAFLDPQGVFSQDPPQTIPKRSQNDSQTIPTCPPNVYRRRPTPIADPVLIFIQAAFVDAPSWF